MIGIPSLPVLLSFSSMGPTPWWQSALALVSSDDESDDASSQPVPSASCSVVRSFRSSRAAPHAEAPLLPRPPLRPRSQLCGWQPSRQAVEWVRAVTLNGSALRRRKQQDLEAGVGSLGLRPRPAKRRRVLPLSPPPSASSFCGGGTPSYCSPQRQRRRVSF